MLGIEFVLAFVQIVHKCKNMEMTKVPLSIRERNHLGTWSSIHEAAARIALEVGLSNTTVLAITEEAGISMRSFFNYFPTKEDAVLGVRSGTISHEALVKFQTNDADALRRAVMLMVDVMRSLTPDSGLSTQQVRLIRKFPELRARITQHIVDAEKLILPIVTEQIKNDLTFAPNLNRAIPDEAARALVMLAGVTGRLAYNKAPSNFSIDPKSLDHAIALFKSAIEES